VLSLFLEVKAIPNNAAQLISGGVFFFGLGEWKNHKLSSQFKPPNAYTGPSGIVSWTERRPDHFGRLLDLLGVAGVVFGTIKLF